ncbi:DinB family protein [Cytobacillus sp. Sa5YUA1]|uniref:DinB family protein n=1 Tax=Cytobacillus stercorigallinarum TaxID=2762240 RepID=A0ABR8QTX2_9BACI|nr:DinB family protein [Cytobacillus stercorigallinarum]MBD7938877.1 DinB family protein [Cytobacillus stercorigallinarum]
MHSQKQAMIRHHEQFIQFIESIPASHWRKEINEGKWSVAEVVGHFIPWDEFILRKRLPFLLLDLPLPKAPSADEINPIAAETARNQSQETIIAELIVKRKQIIEGISKIPDAYWHKTIIIGNKKISLYDYLIGLAAHDEHHMKQISAILSSFNGMI